MRAKTGNNRTMHLSADTLQGYNGKISDYVAKVY